MQVIRSERYQCLGFNHRSDNGWYPGWVFQQIPPKGALHFEPNILIVSSAKYVDRGRVYFMKSDGTVESSAAEPALAYDRL